MEIMTSSVACNRIVGLKYWVRISRNEPRVIFLHKSTFVLLLFTTIILLSKSQVIQGIQSNGHDNPFSSKIHLSPVDATFHQNEINVTVLLPFDSRYIASVGRTGPAILLGFEKVRELQLLPNYKAHLHYIDSNCSNIMAPYEAMRVFVNKDVNVFFGPTCELALGKQK